MARPSAALEWHQTRRRYVRSLSTVHSCSDETCALAQKSLRWIRQLLQNDNDLHSPNDASIRRVANGFSHKDRTFSKLGIRINAAALSYFAASLQVQEPIASSHNQGIFRWLPLPLGHNLPAKLRATRRLVVFPYSPLLLCAVVTRVLYGTTGWWRDSGREGCVKQESLPLVEHTLTPASSE